MKILFNWCDSFFENGERHDNEEILSLKIEQSEGSFAKAKVTMRTAEIRHNFARIGIDEDGKIQLLFVGRVISFPISTGSPSMTIELLSEPPNYHHQLQNFCAGNMRKYHDANFDLANDRKKVISVGKDLYFDDLFFPESAADNPTIFLEGSNKIFYWSMRTGKMQLSDLNTGEKNFKIRSENILQNSMRIRLAREPYGQVKINIVTDWIQKIYGYVELLSLIATHFRHNIISSFTDICSGFKNISENGYSVCFHDVKKINPNREEAFTHLPTESVPIKITQPNSERFINFRRFYYKGQFVVNWEFHQKRVEIAELSLTDPKYSRTKNISIKLNPIQLSKDYPHWYAFRLYSLCDRVIYNGSIYECIEAHRSEKFEEKFWRRQQKIPDALTDDMSASFFETPRGQHCIRYALRKAVALINYSRRCVFVNFTVDANKFYNLTVNDSVTLPDNGNISGKVVRTQLMMNDSQRLMKITIACAEKNSADIWKNLGNFSFLDERDNADAELRDIVKEISVENPPEEQEARLKSQTFPTVASAKSFLRKFATKIKVVLHPLSTKREIIRHRRISDIKI